MSAARTTTGAAQSDRAPARPTELGWARAALLLGIGSTIAFAAIAVLATTTSGGGRFQHRADYWFTACGVPIAIAEIVLVIALWTLQDGRAGRLALTGMVLVVTALVVLVVGLTASVVLGVEERWGPTYVVATLVTFVGHGLFVAGSWRTGLLPRWLLGIWPVVWVIGSLAAQGATPLLLAALYAAMAVLLTRRSRQPVSG
jgi:uncharacterized membrane protein